MPPGAVQSDRDESAVREDVSTRRHARLDPFRLDVHRTDGSIVVETALDAEDRPWAYASLNDTFTVRRRCRQEDAFYGLGEKTGAGNRKGRDFALWNTDVLDPTSGPDRTSIEFDPYYVSIPFFYHHTYPAGPMAASFVDNGHRGEYEFSPDEEYRITFHGGHYTEYVFAGPGMREILAAYTWLTGRMTHPAVVAGVSPVRWFHYTRKHRADRRGIETTTSRATRCGSKSST